MINAAKQTKDKIDNGMDNLLKTITRETSNLNNLNPDV